MRVCCWMGLELWWQMTQKKTEVLNILLPSVSSEKIPSVFLATQNQGENGARKIYFGGQKLGDA